jgi:SWI/SNF-related matrix-associated actin-dependent regulator of chromatin subfamily B protein 1
MLTQYQQPPPPPWLKSALSALQKKYPNDTFEGWMKVFAIRKDNNEVIRPDNPTDQDNIKYQWLPRIKCLDCPGKVYTAVPDNPAENFEVHLRNRAHRDKVEARKAGKRT